MFGIKKYYLLFFINHFLSCSKPPLENLAGFHASYCEQKLYCISPLRGAIAVESGFLKKILSCNAKNATTQLLKTLFVIEEDGEFFTTAYAPYSTFTPATIGLLVGKAYTKTLYEKKDNRFTALTELFKTFKGANSPKRISHLISTIQQSQEEEDEETYLGGTTFKILLGFLYLNAQSSDDDFIKYTNEIEKLLSVTLSRAASPLNNFAGEPQGFEQIVFHEIVQEQYPPGRVPKTEWKRGVFYQPPTSSRSEKKHYKPISDCCESAIRALLNELIFNPDTQQFDLGRLPIQLFNNLPEQLINFYSTHCCAKTSHDINNYQVHNDWMHVVSALPEVEYRKDALYEIDPSLTNIIITLARICGIHLYSKNTHLDFRSLVAVFCKHISRTPFYSLKLSSDLSRKDDKDTDATFVITQYEEDIQKAHYPITLHVRPNHAWLSQDIPHHHAFLEPSTWCYKMKHHTLQQLQENTSLEITDLALFYTNNLATNCLDVANLLNGKELPL